MTEPVAYMWKTAGGNVLGFQEYKDDIPYPGYATPLYTAEQLHPRVKMTQAEFDEFEHLYLFYPSLYNVMYHINHEPKEYPVLNKKLFDEYPHCTEMQKVFSNLYNNFDPDNPEETIEIIPDMKLFVRSKEKIDGAYQVLWDNSKNVNIYHGVFYGKVEDDVETAKYGIQFSTKEEADYWVEPFSEAVQLPVEGE